MARRGGSGEGATGDGRTFDIVAIVSSSIHPSVHMSVCRSVLLSICSSTCQFIHMFIYSSIFVRLIQTKLNSISELSWRETLACKFSIIFFENNEVMLYRNLAKLTVALNKFGKAQMFGPGTACRWVVADVNSLTHDHQHNQVCHVWEASQGV